MAVVQDQVRSRRYSLLERWRYLARLFQVAFGILSGLAGNLITNIGFADSSWPRDLWASLSALSFTVAACAFATWGWFLEDARDAGLMYEGSDKAAFDYLMSGRRRTIYRAVQITALVSVLVAIGFFMAVMWTRSAPEEVIRLATS